MRQLQITFNLETKKVIMVHANCSHDNNMIVSPLPETKYTPEIIEPKKDVLKSRYIIIGVCAFAGILLIGIVIAIVRWVKRRKRQGYISANPQEKATEKPQTETKIEIPTVQT